MYEVSDEKKAALLRVEKIAENLFDCNNLYQSKLDKVIAIDHLVNLFDKFSIEELKAIDNGDLTDRIDSLLVIKAVAGTLNDLTPEQIKIFDAAVEGK